MTPAEASPPPQSPAHPIDPPPPFGRSWKRVYLGVILSQVVVVLLLALFGEVLS